VGTELSCADLSSSVAAKDLGESQRQGVATARDRKEQIYYLPLLHHRANGAFQPQTFSCKLSWRSIPDTEPQNYRPPTPFRPVYQIGDHNQLSTIVLQDSQFSGINEPALRELDLLIAVILY
jgi:DNA replication ATP-dependent helicase Dna2